MDERLVIADGEEVLRYGAPQPERQPTRKLDANDILHAAGAGGLRDWYLSPQVQAEVRCLFRSSSPVLSVGQLWQRYPKMREPIIDGLLRRGETLNVIAPSKVGKSVLIQGLVMCIITGRKWLSTFQCTPGRVLVVDNELHHETASHRTRVIAEAMQVPLDHAARCIDYMCLRGNLVDLQTFGQRIVPTIKPSYYRVVILDALYRFFPPGTDENDNATLAQLYNTIDHYAEELDTSFVVIHHTSKGAQAGKTVTDVGSGGGSMARAADMHMILREHEDQDVAVVEVAGRTYRRCDPFCIRFEYPLWILAEQHDPEALKGRKEEPQTKAKVQEFIRFEEFVDANILVPMTAKQIYDLVLQHNLPVGAWNQRKSTDWCNRAVGTGHLRLVQSASGRAGSTYLALGAPPPPEAQPQPPETEAVAGESVGDI